MQQPNMFYYPRAGGQDKDHLLSTPHQPLPHGDHQGYNPSSGSFGLGQMVPPLQRGLAPQGQQAPGVSGPNMPSAQARYPGGMPTMMPSMVRPLSMMPPGGSSMPSMPSMPNMSSIQGVSAVGNVPPSGGVSRVPGVSMSMPAAPSSARPVMSSRGLNGSSGGLGTASGLNNGLGMPPGAPGLNPSQLGMNMGRPPMATHMPMGPSPNDPLLALLSKGAYNPSMVMPPNKMPGKPPYGNMPVFAPMGAPQSDEFDLEFPALGRTVATKPPEWSSDRDFPALPGFKQSGEVHKPHPDEQVVEHFPPLPSTYHNGTNIAHSSNYVMGNSGPSLRQLSGSGNVPPPPPGLASFDTSTGQQQRPNIQSPRKGSITSATNSSISASNNINSNSSTSPSTSPSLSSLPHTSSLYPSSAPSHSAPLDPSPDPFGLLGLLDVIRMTEPDLNILALGTDLTTLGLNLNSPECLYSSFASPFAENAARREPEYFLPSCYYTQPPMQSPTMKMHLFSEETLFYMFYSMPRDVLQMHAANELYNRDWRYHKEHKLWFTRVHGTEATHKSPTAEKGSYYYFDIGTWEKVRKDNFLLVYEMLETKAN
eukprot:TRINITY_DN6054_c0_g1_i3.p1 TRINITY_DN6054_c0_g1~~TRINITY_DN6054_c0_g1_i3.p1  ORF type:complete len:593 (+),score=122.85 TRINITY_DN6054_c0_g1_i3:120-1898(+)